MATPTLPQLGIDPGLATYSAPTPTPKRQRGSVLSFWAIVLIALAAALFGFGATRGMGTASGFIFMPIMFVLWIPVLRHEAAADRGFDAVGLMLLGFGAKMVSSFGRLFMVDELYNGNGDSTGYHSWGRTLSAYYRDFEFNIDPERPVPGTGFIRILTGVVYTITGTDKFVGFLVFSMFALYGSYLLFAAFATAVPQGHLLRYGLLIFLWPSVVFWPSSIGKESWMLLGLGLGAWGASRLVTGQRGGLLSAFAGLLAMYMVRPHVAILMLAAVGVGMVVNAIFKTADDVKSVGFVSKALMLGVLVVAGSLLAPRVASFLNVDDVGGSGFDAALDYTQQQTTQGGSSFAAAEVGSIADYPWAFLTVVFRPFPWEVNSLQGVISAAEGMMLFGLLALSARRLMRLPTEAIKRPYAAFAAAFIFMFCYVFSFIGNFGILARQRSQLLPFVFVMAALPLGEKAHRKVTKFRELRIDSQPVEEDSPSETTQIWERNRGKLNVITRPLPPPSGQQ